MRNLPDETQYQAPTNQPDQTVRQYKIHHYHEPRHEDCAPRHHDWREGCCNSCGQRRCICKFKPFQRMEVAPELCDLGVRLVQTVLTVPLAIAGGVLAELSKCRPDPCFHQHKRHDHGDCCDDKHYDCCNDKKHYDCCDDKHYDCCDDRKYYDS